MKILAILAALFLSIGYGHAQTYEKFVEKSFDFLDKNDLVSAEESLRAAMRLEPGNPNNYALLMNLGTIQRRQGKLEDALLSYTAALSRHPNNEAILENRAGLYTEMGEIEKATNDYNALLILNPHHQEALYCRAMLHLQHKNYLLAEQDFDKILEVNEKSVKGRLGHAILEKLRGNYDESERIFNYLINGDAPRMDLIRGPCRSILHDGQERPGYGRYQIVFSWEKYPDSRFICICEAKVKPRPI